LPWSWKAIKGSRKELFVHHTHEHQKSEKPWAGGGGRRIPGTLNQKEERNNN
jgi:hypothetical protein